ncbi:MAG: DUF4315 family protein [Clostridia bacterium]|nr:DUF4315 family protein [Clostridia bacterium]MBQ3472081.1 DUF4315 family protein [Clostridia bacterium]MBR0089604.1 DUF4315 family protein [Clostridia bacterium]
MATVEKIEKDIESTKKKISDLQKKLKTLEAQKKEAENLQIVNLVKAVKMDKETLTVFLKAYAKGDIELPDEYIEELETAAASAEQEDTDNEE